MKDGTNFRRILGCICFCNNWSNSVENPIPIDMPIKIKLFPNDTAANSVEPKFPTIILSTIPIRVCPNIPKMTG